MDILMEQSIQEVGIATVIPNKENPRTIDSGKFKELVQSIKEFPQMLKIRPIAVDENMTVLGGNMRLKACKKAGLKKVWIIVADGWTKEQKEEFIIKDNLSFGKWNWDELKTDWNMDSLASWGMELPEEWNFSDQNNEIDVDEFPDMLTMKLQFTEEDYNNVKSKLDQIADTPEAAILKLLSK